MPTIAEDLSTPLPAYANGPSGQQCQVAFSPPGACELVAMVGCHVQSGTPSIAISDTGGHTWTQKVQAGTGEWAAIYTAPCITAPGKITVTATNSAAQDGTLALVVRVDDGVNTVQTGVATANNSNLLSTSAQLQITPSTAASWVYTLCVGGGPELKVTPVNQSLLTIDNYQDASGGSTFLTGRQILPTSSPPVAESLGWNWTVAHSWTIVAVEVLAADVPKASSDTGSGNDTTPAARVQAMIYAAETGFGNQVTKGITGTGAPSLTTSADTGTGTDATGSVPLKWANVGSADSGTGSDGGAGPPLLRVASADYAAGVDSNTVPAMKPGFQFFMNNAIQEGFSVDRVAILNPSGGAESQQLYGAQVITLVPEMVTSDMVADDEEYATWYNVTKANLTVTNGYMNFATIDQLSGPGINMVSSGASPADYYGLPLWTQYQHNKPAVPLAFRMMSRNANGGVRTLTFVLYKVQLAVLDFTGIVYKTGLQVNYAGTVLFSTTDEQGNTLPGPEMGRLVSSAGNLAGAFGPQAFAGV